MLRIILSFIFLGSVYASGTFFRPPPPPRTQNLDPQDLKKGEEIYRKQVGSQSCAGCHHEGQKQAFRRRSLSRAFRKFGETIRDCQLDAGRMGLQVAYVETPEDLQAIKTYLAKEYRLEEYL